MTLKHLRDSEDGWTMVPVMIFMVVALGLGFALLAVVDQQTREGRVQRSGDAAQTLAEGVVSSTANVLAAAPTHFAATTSCERISGDLSVDSTAPSGSLRAQVTEEVQDRFSESSPDYAADATTNTTWRVDVCPVADGDERWTDGNLTRTVANRSAKPEVWVRAQAAVRSPRAATRPVNVRSVVSKVRQDATTFGPPKDFAVGTGAFSTDVGTGLNTVLTAGVAKSLLGTTPLIADSSTSIGVRCGLLTTLSNPSSTCVTGSLAAAGQITNAAGLGALNSALGLDRTRALGTWTMAPADAVAAWKAEAQATGVYTPASSPVAGYGNARTKSISGTRADCFDGTPTNQQVIYIEQVGDGDQYCDVPPSTTAKMLIIGRGAVRIAGDFTGVVYALNRQECTQSDGSCSTGDRTGAVTREVVRIEGNSGRVTGAVWADGAGGAVGIYPSLNPNGVSSSALLSVGDAQTGICGLPLLGPVVNTLGTAVNNLTGLVGNILGGVLGTQEEVRYPNGGSAPSGCELLRTQLGSLTSSQLLNVFGNGGTQTVVISERRTRNCVLLGCGQWSAWTTRDSANVTIPQLLTSQLPSVVEQVSGLLGATVNSYSAITYRDDVVTNSATSISQGAGPVIGTYRNVSTAAD